MPYQNRSSASQSPYTTTIILASMTVLLLITAWMGAHGLDSKPIWTDEQVTMVHIGAWDEHFNLADMVTSIREESQAHSPGYFAILGVWAELTGWSPITLRYLSLLMGLLAVAFTYRLGSDLISNRAGFYAAVVVGTSGFYTHYLYEMRMYSMVATTTAFAVWMYYRFLTHPRPAHVSWLAWLALFVSALLPSYTHYFGIIVSGVIGGYHVTFGYAQLVWRRSPGAFRYWLLITVVLIAGAASFFLPWLNVLLEGTEMVHTVSNLAATALSVDRLIEETVTRFGNGYLVLPALCFVLAAVAAFPIRRNTAFVWIMAGMVLLGTIVVNETNEVIPARRLRYMVVIWPLLALLVGLGLHTLRRWHWATTALIVVWAVIGINAGLENSLVQDQGGATYTFPLHKVDDTVEPMITQDDGLVVFGKTLAKWRVRDMDMPTYYMQDLAAQFYYVDHRRTKSLTPVKDTLFNYDRIWVVYQTHTRTDQLTEFEEAARLSYDLRASYNGPEDIRADLYVKRAPTG